MIRQSRLLLLRQELQELPELPVPLREQLQEPELPQVQERMLRIHQ